MLQILWHKQNEFEESVDFFEIIWTIYKQGVARVQKFVGAFIPVVPSTCREISVISKL
jgi:hypothetical protein